MAAAGNPKSGLAAYAKVFLHLPPMQDRPAVPKDEEQGRMAGD
jgi:hypothetical protein